MNKLYARLLSLGLMGCASGNKIVDHPMKIGGEPAVVTEDGKKCHLRKRISDLEIEFDENGEKREERVYGDQIVVSYTCGKPDKIEAARTAFKDLTLGYHFFGENYIKSLVKEAEEKRNKKKVEFSERDFRENLSSILQ